MSRIVDTELGRFRAVIRHYTREEQMAKYGDFDASRGEKSWLWECPCGQWGSLSEAQFVGNVSVNHAADGCPVKYHETHNFAKALVVKMQAAILMGEQPWHEDTDPPKEGA